MSHATLDAPVSGPPLMAGDPAADAVRRTRLRRMKLVALSLLVFAAIVYALTRDRDGFWGFVNAGAEASMVGAMADWFAVTALFRHPLGLPVPHTALVPEAQGRLRPQPRGVLRRELPAGTGDPGAAGHGRELAGRVGAWLADPLHARRVVHEAASAMLPSGCASSRTTTSPRWSRRW